MPPVVLRTFATQKCAVGDSAKKLFSDVFCKRENFEISVPQLSAGLSLFRERRLLVDGVINIIRQKFQYLPVKNKK